MQENNNVPSTQIIADANANAARTDFQHVITDPSPLYQALLVAFNGYKIEHFSDVHTVLGETRTEDHVMLTPPTDKNKYALCNTECTGFIFGQVWAFIGPLTVTSKLTDKIIYSQWNTFLRTLRHTLLKSQYIEGNPYEIKAHRVPMIMSTLTALAMVTMKATDGYALDKLIGTFVTTRIEKETTGQEKKPGFFDKLF